MPLRLEYRVDSRPQQVRGKMSKIELTGLVAKCLPAAADDLIDRVCGTEWATAEERYAAQALVFRLERMKWRGDAREPGDGTALRPEVRRSRPAPKVAG
jgi:hypothetical protein